MKRLLKHFSVFTIVALIFSAFAVPSAAVNVEIAKRELNYFESVSDKNPKSYKPITVSLMNTVLNDKAYLINETTYIPLRAATELSGATVTYNSRTRVATVTRADLVMTVTDGAYITEANGRALLSKTPTLILDDGKMYIPVRILAKALSLEVEWLPPAAVRLGGVAKGLTSAEEYYRSDDLYWLSKIISAESKGEPLLGQIAVGNVVLNRKAHKDYPNTIYGVIFDRKYGVQFSPVSNGSIYREPTYSSTLAAKICLEGVSVSDKILFFMQPERSTSSWIANNRP